MVPKFNFIRESLTQISEKGKGKKLIEGFNNRPDGLCIFDFSIKIVQRFPKYVLMMQELINSSKFSQKQKEALEKIYPI
ncbi:MAG: hypothetical protein HWD61_01575 [Parachlamydiaceae bacterium]|nr:MAG: hypothetical protein HWD61_01575 [Parachlamydiaceae bacterium]